MLPENAENQAGYFYVPIGVVRRSFFPGETGRSARGTGQQNGFLFIPEIKQGFHDLKLTPTLEPLAAVKDKITLITGWIVLFKTARMSAQSSCINWRTPYSVEIPLSLDVRWIISSAIRSARRLHSGA